MSITIDENTFLQTGIEYDPILVMAAIAGATLLIEAISEIASGVVVNDHIAANTIVAYNKLVAESIDTEQIAANAITATRINANAITTDKLAADSITSVKITSGAITTSKLAANAVTADKIQVDSLDAISAVLGSVTAGSIIGVEIKTSNDPGYSRVLIDSAGLRGYDSTLGLTFRIPTDGSSPLFASGQIQYATIIETTIISNDFKTSSELPWLEMTDSGMAYRETEAIGKYGSGVEYGDGTEYGVGVFAFYGNSGKPILSVEKERTLADIRMYNRGTNPSGAAVVGDLAVINGILKICTTAGTPGTWSCVGTQSSSSSSSSSGE